MGDMQGTPIPYHIKEKIAEDYHKGILSDSEIAKKHNVAEGSLYHIYSEFKPIYFVDRSGRIGRVSLIITRKIHELMKENNTEALNEVAEVLSKY